LLKYGGPDGLFLTPTMMKNLSDGLLATNPQGRKPCRKKEPSNGSQTNAPNAVAKTSSMTTILERPFVEVVV